MKNAVAVIMSVYKNDKYEYVKLAVNSIIQQSYDNLYFIVISDGEVDISVSSFLHELSLNKTSFIYLNERKENKGLAYSLNECIDYVINNLDVKYIARMDADDICFLDRIHTQVDFLENNLLVDVVGTDLIEISNEGVELFHKKMKYYHNDILSNLIKKCPFNHPTVMFRISVFMDSNIRYNSKLMNTQDYYLWVDLLAEGCIFANISKPLLYFRIDDSFHSRRGWNKAINDLHSRLYAFKRLNVLSFSNVLHVVFLFLLRLAPSSIKTFAYKYLR